MSVSELLAFTCDILEKLGIDYLVTGSTATSFYGEPRLTNDIDIVIELSLNQVDGLLAAFSGDDFYLDRESILDALRRQFMFNVIQISSGLKLDFIILSNSEFDRSRKSRRRLLPILVERSVWFASPEDVIIKKMLYFREGGSEKHLRDCAGVLRINSDEIELEYIEHWADEFGVRDVWRRIRELASTSK